MANEDYKLEELENAAVNKSNNAKRAAAAAGLFAAGGGTTYAATKILEPEPVTPPDEEAVKKAAELGFNQVSKPEVKHQPTPAPKPKPEPVPTPPDDKPQIEKTTIYVDEDGERIATLQEGKLNGHKVALADTDGDMRADLYAYDEDGNGIYNEDEITELKGRHQIPMKPTDTGEMKVEVVRSYDIPGYYPEDEGNNSIHNNFEDEKTGESYKHDYAERSGNYNNHANAEQYSEDTPIYAEPDDEYDSLASNDEAADDTFDDLGSDALDIV